MDYYLVRILLSILDVASKYNGAHLEQDQLI